MITALKRLNVNSDYILIDGHFCLQSDSGLIEIPIETFQEMNIAAVVLLTDDSNEIYKRLYARDNSSLDEAVIQSLQEAEGNRAIHVANTLGTPLLEAQIYDVDPILYWLKSNK